MKKLFYSGVVHPERAQLSVSNIENHLLTPDGDAYATLKFNIYNNQISAVVESKSADEDLYTMRNVVKTGVEIITNLLGFLKGYAYDVEIVKAFDSDLEISFVFGVDIPSLENRNKQRTFAEADHIYPVCLGPEGVYARRCMADLNMAMKHPDDTAFYCYRALESLKQYFGHLARIDGDREQWEEMARVLGGTKNDLEPIRLLAFPARHGIPKPITDKERSNTFLFTWQIVEKFIDYRLEQLGSTFRLQSLSKNDKEPSN